MFRAAVAQTDRAARSPSYYSSDVPLQPPSCLSNLPSKKRTHKPPPLHPQLPTHIPAFSAYQTHPKIHIHSPASHRIPCYIGHIGLQLTAHQVSLTAFANGWLVDTFGPMKVTILAGANGCGGKTSTFGTFGTFGTGDRWSGDGRFCEQRLGERSRFNTL